MIIRKASKEDLPAIHSLVGELAIFEKEPDEFTCSLEDYFRDFDENWFEALVAEIDGQIAGMALFYETYSTWKGRMLYLEDFIVRQEMRSNGIGQALFDRFLLEAKKRKCAMAKWEVLDWNEGAVRFYERNNAAIEKNWWDGKIVFDQ